MSHALPCSIRTARVEIAPAALSHNLARVRAFAPRCRVMAVIKANAYGHGMATAAHALDDADAFALVMPGEAVLLRKAGIYKPLVVLQGYSTMQELKLCAEYQLQPVIHSPWQVDLLEQADENVRFDVWLKIDTGMHRFGIDADGCADIFARLRASYRVGEISIMSHLANADVPQAETNRRQLECFLQATTGLDAERSLANSGAIVAMPDSHLDWVRPGIMLYGSSPLGAQSAAALDLRPAMQFESRLAAVRQLKRGDAIGYGGSWTCPEDMPVGLVAAGYGDGYPRHAPSGTPVWVNGRNCPIIGRVSMDSLYVDLRGVQAAAGDRAVLWGRELDADAVARHVGTITYELFCHVGNSASLP